MKTRLATALLGAALLGAMLTACGGSGSTSLVPAPSQPPATATSEPFPVGSWQLTYDVSGGIDGRSYGFTLTSDGALKLEDRRAKRTASKTVDKAEVDKVARLIAGAGLNQPLPTPVGICADCIDVSITVTSGGKTYSASVSEVIKQPRLDPLLVELNQLYNNNVP